MAIIERIIAREILDSRGEPTLEAEVTLSDGAVGAASVPSGASVGNFEAREIRDGIMERYFGRGVLSARDNVNKIIAPALVGEDAADGGRLDRIMLALDGTDNKSNLGANAILSVSLAVRRAEAASLGIPLFSYLGGALVNKMPMPMMNILNGGRHARNNLDIQEFMIIPRSAKSFSEALRMCSEVLHCLKRTLISRGESVGVGDEGGFAPNLGEDEDALKLMIAALKDAGYKEVRDFVIALDAASSEWYSDGIYYMPKREKKYTSDELIDYFSYLCGKYPIISLEDPLSEVDRSGWERIGDKMSRSGIMLVGDDLFVTDPIRVRDGVSDGIANAVLIKPNQIGTVTEAALAVSEARKGGYKVIISHRSGETEDSFISDLAVALGADFIKSGAPQRGERTAKYNRLLRIEEELYNPTFGI